MQCINEFLQQYVDSMSQMSLFLGSKGSNCKLSNPGCMLCINPGLWGGKSVGYLGPWKPGFGFTTSDMFKKV